MPDRPCVVVGVDIGTTSTKAVAFDTSGAVAASTATGYPLFEGSAGQAEQDPRAVLEAAVTSMRACAAEVAAKGLEIDAWSFSGAMHALLGMGLDDRPLTALVTWGDTRAGEQAARLRHDPAALAIYRRTGTPLHPMSPLVKLVWFRENEPQLFARVSRWVGVKEFVLHELCGEWVVDHSVASGTGLFNLWQRNWDVGALALAGIEATSLSSLVATNDAHLRLLPECAAEIGVAAATPVVVGAADGPLANLGVGAVRPGVAACSLGTSGALRVAIDKPFVDEAGELFCYVLDAEHWIVGGATNNAGVALDWVAETLAPAAELRASELETLELAAEAPPGSDGLIMLAYLLGERAPAWDPFASGAYVGLRRTHRREHLIRAALEGVCQQLALVMESFARASISIDQVRATGGLTQSPFVRQLLADVFGMPIGFPTGQEGSAYGAALLGMQAIGAIRNIDDVIEPLGSSSALANDPETSARYRELRAVHRAIYEALAPSMRKLRAIEAGVSPSVE